MAMFRYILGGILIALGYVLRVMSAMKLGGQFSIYLVGQNSIVKTGIYSKIRHPSYAGSILIYCGLAMISIELAFIDLVFTFYLQRASLEESILASNPDYIEYMKKTKRFIPWIL